MTALAATASAVLATALANRADLATAIDTAALVAEKRNTYPILACVRLRGDGDHLFVTATNLDQTIDVRVAAPADERFDVALPAHLLKALLKGAPKAADMVAFTSPERVAVPAKNGEAAKVAFDGPVLLDFAAARYKIEPQVPEDNWPKPVAINLDSRTFTMSADDLWSLLNDVAFAMSNEETRYYLNGVYMHHLPAANGVQRYNGVPGSLRVVTTDGHRMARQEIVAPSGSGGMAGMILPRSLVELMLKLLKPAKGKTLPDVSVETDGRFVRFMFGEVTITSKLIDGTFPDYERVTPKNNDKLATVDADAFLEAISATSAVATDRGGRAVKLEFCDGQRCRLSCTSPDFGTSETVIGVGWDHAPFEIGFNARYLVEIVGKVRGYNGKVTFQFNDAGSPTLIRGQGGMLCVLMPMRV